jgi:hypothetical protein
MRKIEAFLFIVVLGVAGYFGYNYYKNNLAKQTVTPTTQTDSSSKTDSSSTTSKTLTNISISGDVKSEYKVNEEINFLSAQLQLNYSDNSKEYISLNKTMVPDFDSTTCGDKTYKITYLGNTLTVNYSVNAIDFGKGYILTDNYKFKSGSIISSETNVLTKCYEFSKNGVGIVYQIQNNDFVELSDFTWKYDSTTKLSVTIDNNGNNETATFLINSNSGYIQSSTSVSGNTEYDTLTQKFTYYKYPLKSLTITDSSSLVFYLNDSVDTIDYSKFEIEFVDSNDVSRRIQLAKDIISGLDLTTAGTKTLEISYLGAKVNVSYIVNPVRYGKYKLAMEYLLDNTLQTTIEYNSDNDQYIKINNDKTFEYINIPDSSKNFKSTWELKNNQIEMVINTSSTSTQSFDINGNGKLSLINNLTESTTIINNGTTYSYNKRIDYLVYIG